MPDSIREIENRQSGKTNLRNGRLRNGTGEIAFVLWGSEVDLVEQGDRARITARWVKDFQGRPEIGLGRTGRLENLSNAL